MNLLKLFRLRSRIAKRITELENEVKKLESVKYELTRDYNAYINTLRSIGIIKAIITELKSLI